MVYRVCLPSRFSWVRIPSCAYAGLVEWLTRDIANVERWVRFPYSAFMNTPKNNFPEKDLEETNSHSDNNNISTYLDSESTNYENIKGLIFLCTLSDETLNPNKKD